MLDIVEVLRWNRCAVFLFHDLRSQLLLAESLGLPGFGNLTSKTRPVSGHRFIMAWANPQNHASMRISVVARGSRSEEHTSELQSLMRISYAVFCLKKKIKPMITTPDT